MKDIKDEYTTETHLIKLEWCNGCLEDLQNMAEIWLHDETGRKFCSLHCATLDHADRNEPQDK